MPADQIKKLEGLVAEAVRELKSVSAENNRLAREVKKLSGVKEQVQMAERKNRDQLQELSRREKLQKKIEKDKTVIRSKVQGILGEIEQMDFF